MLSLLCVSYYTKLRQFREVVDDLKMYECKFIVEDELTGETLEPTIELDGNSFVVKDYSRGLPALVQNTEGKIKEVSWVGTEAKTVKLNLDGYASEEVQGKQIDYWSSFYVKPVLVKMKRVN